MIRILTQRLEWTVGQGAREPPPPPFTEYQVVSSMVKAAQEGRLGWRTLGDTIDNALTSHHYDPSLNQIVVQFKEEPIAANTARILANLPQHP